ncbi:MAG: hypothetical protein PQJ59_04940 [Spirochaetales bacterium]|nr:hypothetical protein [Spirochaetales bacterium]
MKINKLFPVLTGLLLLLFVACSSEPEPASEPVEEVTPPVEEPVSEPVEEEVFEVTQEVYDKTFDEINALIGHLDEIIAKKNYTEWKENLSDSYIETYSNKELLREKSASPILEMNEVVLKNLEDYFIHVVVPSRMSLNLEEIEFDDKNHVTAWTIFNDNKTKLYQLELIDGSWKISIW